VFPTETRQDPPAVWYRRTCPRAEQTPVLEVNDGRSRSPSDERQAAPITRVDFADYTESIPAFAVVCLMAFTFNIAIGICAGFVLYPIGKLVAGRASHLKPGLWVLTALSLLFFIFYPYS
jgi:hypothetical protein